MSADSFEMLMKFGLENKVNLRTERVDISRPRWDETTYLGRLRHFGIITNPANIFYSDKYLQESKEIVDKYRNGEDIPGLTVEKLWQAKYVVDSSFHPETGEKMKWFGRMSAQVPCGMSLTGAMLSFINTRTEIIFWQWCNQSFNAFVNYTNRSSNKPVGISDMAIPYLSGTTGSLLVAYGLNSIVQKAPRLVQRWVPLGAVLSANFVNIPLTRQEELKNGVRILNSDGKEVGYSKIAAKKAISQVLISRIALITPAMLIIPIIMNSIEKKSNILRKYPKIGTPLQVFLCGIFLTFTVPASCSIYPQRASIPFTSLELSLQEKIKRDKLNPDKDIDLVKSVYYFNKGL